MPSRCFRPTMVYSSFVTTTKTYVAIVIRFSMIKYALEIIWFQPLCKQYFRFSEPAACTRNNKIIKYMRCFLCVRYQCYTIAHSIPVHSILYVLLENCVRIVLNRVIHPVQSSIQATIGGLSHRTRRVYEMGKNRRGFECRRNSVSAYGSLPFSSWSYTHTTLIDNDTVKVGGNGKCLRGLYGRIVYGSWNSACVAIVCS